MMTDITYRTPDLSDARALAALGRQSFVDAFAHLYSSENLNRFLDENYSVEALESDLANPRRIFRVVEEGGVLFGYCKLGLDYGFDFDIGARKAMELKQLYLLGGRTGSGVGSTLTHWAIAEAKQRGYDDIILSVYSENFGAQRFYQRHGFTHIADTYFMVGDHRDDEFLYGLSLTAA
jgi:diamine N-acetyltransferase